jgi:hypothetical protein
MKQMEQNNEQPWNYSFNIQQSWPKNNWAAEWFTPDEITELHILAQDLLELDVEQSGNTDAVAMLSNIGISC